MLEAILCAIHRPPSGYLGASQCQKLSIICSWQPDPRFKSSAVYVCLCWVWLHMGGAKLCSKTHMLVAWGPGAGPLGTAATHALEYSLTSGGWSPSKAGHWGLLGTESATQIPGKGREMAPHWNQSPMPPESDQPTHPPLPPQWGLRCRVWRAGIPEMGWASPGCCWWEGLCLSGKMDAVGSMGMTKHRDPGSFSPMSFPSASHPRLSSGDQLHCPPSAEVQGEWLWTKILCSDPLKNRRICPRQDPSLPGE